MRIKSKTKFPYVKLYTLYLLIAIYEKYYFFHAETSIINCFLKTNIHVL